LKGRSQSLFFIKKFLFNKTLTFLKNFPNKPTIQSVHTVEETKQQKINSKKEKIIMSKFVETNEKIAEAVVEGYKKIEDGVVEGYKKIEQSAVEGFNKVADKCVEKLFTKEGETVEEAKKRLSGEE